MNIKYQSLDKENALQQIELFASLDIVIGAHGAGLTNIIFMSPKSFLYELFPPFWQFACYKRLASNMDIQYLKSTAVGEKGPECNKNEKSTLCQYNGIRRANMAARYLPKRLVIQELYFPVYPDSSNRGFADHS